MSRSDAEPPLIEMVIVPCLFADGAHFEIHEEFVRIVAWVELPGGDGATERRLVARLVMPCNVARTLAKDMYRDFRRGGH